MTITRINATDFAVITNTVLADGSFKSDYCCRLTGNVLRSHEDGKSIRIGGLIRVNLGPVSLPKVQALAIGESVVLS